MTQTWETLRKEARRLETEIDGKLVEYAKLASSLQTNSSSTASTRTSFESHRTGNDDEAVHRRGTASRDTLAAETMTSDMDALLTKLSAVIDAMGSTSGSSGPPGGGPGSGGAGGGGGGAPPTKPGGAAVAHTLQRHAEILNDYRQEFRKTRGSIASLREHAELLAGAGGLANGGGGGTSTDAAGLDMLYKERASVAAASAGADSTIATGLSLKEDLDRQRAMFASMVERVETMSEGLPAVNRLIGQIRRKKKRDVLILAAVVSTLLFITFSWKVAG